MMRRLPLRSMGWLAVASGTSGESGFRRIPLAWLPALLLLASAGLRLFWTCGTSEVNVVQMWFDGLLKRVDRGLRALSSNDSLGIAFRHHLPGDHLKDV